MRPEPAVVDVVTASVVCARLRSLGCPEGKPTPAGRSCETVLEDARKLRPFPEGCWADAGTREEAVACGGLRCRD